MEMKLPESLNEIQPIEKKRRVSIVLVFVFGLVTLSILGYFGYEKYKVVQDQKIMEEISSLSIDKQMGETFMIDHTVLTGEVSYKA